MKSDLITSITAFEFYQAVRLINRSLVKQSGSLSFKMDPTLAFPAFELQKIQCVLPHQWQLWVNFMGLVGSDAVLPESDTERVLERLQQKDSTLLSFLTIFHNQSLHLFYKLSTASRYYLAYEINQSHPVMEVLAGLSGQMGAHREWLFHHAGLLGMQARSSEGLRLLLENYFELPIQISQYAPEWIDLSKSEISQLAAHNNHLGVDLILGKRVWHVQNKITILIGPVDYGDLACLLPGGDFFIAFNEIAKTYLGMEYDYQIKLLVYCENLPSACLSRKEKNKKSGTQLGWGTWLKIKNKKEESVGSEMLVISL